MEHAGCKDHGKTEFYDSVGTIIFGATTYEQSLTFGEWPFTDKKTYVLTDKPLAKPAQGVVEFYSGDVKKLLDQIRAESNQHIWLMGGSYVIADFLEKNLINEMMLFVIPVLLGEGIPLFKSNPQQHALQLIDAIPYPCGIAQLRYLAL